MTCRCNIMNRLTCLQVLNIMVILGFMLNYMLRVNLAIAIVSMVMPYNKSSTHSNNSHDIIPNDNRTITGDAIKRSIEIVTNDQSTTNGSMLTSIGHEVSAETRYPWNEYEVNLILGSFYWGYICTEIPGGRMAEIIGTKRVFGYSMLVSSAITLLIPLFSTFGYVALVILRIALGFMLGATWPAIHPMIARWIPPTERSKFVSNMMASSLGAAITLPICGYLIASFGWESVFYVTGTIGLTWSIAWFYFVYDSPSQHPRISVEERNYIEESIGTTSSIKHFPVPWKSIFTSLPVWAILITHACSVFGYFTMVDQLPTYMKYILNFNIKKNGLLSSLPYLGKYIFALTTSTLADYLRRNNKLSVTAIRKSFTTFAVMSPGLLMIVQSYLGRDPTTSVAIFTIGLTINGAVTAGYLGNGLDIAPNFSGTIFGIANTLSSFGGFLSSFIIGTITYQNQTYEQWRKVFWILAGTYCTGALAFALLGTGKLQKWNYPDIKSYEKNKNNLERNGDVDITEPLNNKTLS
ncbi:hypothetical protein M0802_010850 [Mischocyttarus mexicanus]|nr:hypothetical protein M0802_010850 [Mischocyttarus mexicanus]